jgi:hypothetical protein
MKLEAEPPESAGQKQNVVAGCRLAGEADQTDSIFSRNARDF